MKVEVLKCFKTEQGLCGEFYVYDSNGRKELVLENCNNIKVFAHFSGKTIEDCLVNPTSKVREAVLIASIEYLRGSEDE